jgi:nitrite reductase/ring-hydroxylating ferredoxin subunit/uncharacterized membrane protein
MSAIKQVLEGRPVRVPLHAAIVHFPLACFSIATVLDCVSWILPDPDLHFVASAFWAIVAGIGTALVAAVLGFVDYTTIRDDHPSKKHATAHMILNLASVALYAGSLLWRKHELEASHTPPAALAASMVGFLVLVISGYIGGHMVYNDGIGVGRHRRRTPLPERTMDSGDPDEDDYSPVCHVDEFIEGGTLRANIRGTVVAIAKSDGVYYAFQEYCSHRFGPLSEGSVQNGQIVCPWHRSCFNMDSGKVEHGPAKVPLKTYPIEVRGNRLYVKVPAPSRHAK